MLTMTDKASFNEFGWCGPFNLLNDDEISRLQSAAEARWEDFYWPNGHQPIPDPATTEKHWFKSIHINIPEFGSLCRRPEIATRVTEIIGEPSACWGLTVKYQPPEKVHRWHMDIEHSDVNGLTVFIGLSGLDSKSTLNVIPQSHRWKGTPQDYGICTDEQMTNFITANQLNTDRLPLPITDGQFCIFHGRLWHGSNNQSGNERRAAIAQYCSRQQRISVPLSWDLPIVWAVKKAENYSV